MKDSQKAGEIHSQMASLFSVTLTLTIPAGSPQSPGCTVSSQKGCWATSDTTSSAQDGTLRVAGKTPALLIDPSPTQAPQGPRQHRIPSLSVLPLGGIMTHYSTHTHSVAVHPSLHSDLFLGVLSSARSFLPPSHLKWNLHHPPSIPTAFSL